MAEWLKAADCKSAHVSVRRFESFPAHHIKTFTGGLAQLVERLLCKQNVIGSNPVSSTIFSIMRSGRLTVRTPGFHPGNQSSILCQNAIRSSSSIG